MRLPYGGSTKQITEQETTPQNWSEKSQNKRITTFPKCFKHIQNTLIWSKQNRPKFDVISQSYLGMQMSTGNSHTLVLKEHVEMLTKLVQNETRRCQDQFINISIGIEIAEFKQRPELFEPKRARFKPHFCLELRVFKWENIVASESNIQQINLTKNIQMCHLNPRYYVTRRKHMRARRSLLSFRDEFTFPQIQNTRDN